MINEPDVNSFLEAVCDGNQAVAEQLLAANPWLATAGIHTAAVIGEAELVDAMLMGDPALATTKGGPKNWEPLAYLGCSRFHCDHTRRADRMVRIARMLLAAGASPNTTMLSDDGEPVKLPVLWAVTSIANNPALARVLLAAGANPNDGESIYHAAERNHRECLVLLREFGANLSGPIQPWNNTPLYFILGHKPNGAMAESVFGGVQWLLENGADPNVASYECQGRPIHLAARHGWGIELFELLARHGADLDVRTADGKSAYALAAQRGNSVVTAWLSARGARTDLSPVDEFVSACGRGDGETVNSILAANPGFLASLSDGDKQVVMETAGEGRAAALQLMLPADFSIDTPDRDGATLLHYAALSGSVETVRVVLARNPSLEVEDQNYHATPLGWAAWASVNQYNREGDYAGVVRELLAAGASMPEGIHGSDAVNEVLRGKA